MHALVYVVGVIIVMNCLSLKHACTKNILYINHILYLSYSKEKSGSMKMCAYTAGISYLILYYLPSTYAKFKYFVLILMDIIRISFIDRIFKSTY